MRPTLFVAVATLLACLLAAPSNPQTAQASAQTTPEALRATYDHAMIAKDWPAAVAAAQQLVDANATSDNLFLLGNAQLYATTGKSDTGPMEVSLNTYDRAIAAAQQEKPAEGQPDTAWKDGVAKIYIGRGNALLKLKRNADAIDNYNHAAELSSTPGKAYFNICAVLYNTGDMANGPAACRKATAADPTNANAWFVLGSLLFANAPIDSGKIVISAECRQALEKYLELAPSGPHAADTKAMLDAAAK
jgi:tetratricopeptide (TPR) repeat protein